MVMLPFIHLAVTALAQLVTMVTPTQDTCPFVRYTGSYNLNDHVKDHALTEYSYRNVTVSNPQKCFSACVLDCKCLSYQLLGTRCEVMDEDRHTAPAQFLPTPGYKYYELKQRFKTQSIVAGCGGQCRNGCCRFISCQNGGACVEQCENVKRKFVCNCLSGYMGRLCENPIRSCADLGGIGEQSGIYTIILPLGDELKVYCDLHSEPGVAWTLIESFTFERNSQYKDKPFLIDFQVNQANLDWSDYRLSRSLMLYIKSHATLWRATCRYDTDGFQTKDYMKGLLSDMDIMTYVGKGTCAKFQYINIRGYSCTNCTTHFYQDGSSRHPYVDSHFGKQSGCEWCACEGSVLKPTGLGYNSYDDNFGFYLTQHPDHRCTSSASSTTQWWLGTPVNVISKMSP